MDQIAAFSHLNISTADLALVGLLGFLEILLSFDNALVLAMLAHHLSPQLQKKALTYGLLGAVAFRLIALSVASTLIHSTWIKVGGGAYLIGLALKHFLWGNEKQDSPRKKNLNAGFWKTVILIEIMDIVFAVDSILASVALSQKLWVVFTGGFIGVLAIRFAASFVIRLLDRFPRFEETAYLLILLIGIKVILDAFSIPGLDFHEPGSPASLGFWVLMLGVIGLGFRKA